MQGISSHAVKLPYRRTVGDNVFQLFSPDLQVPVGTKSVEFGFVRVCFVCLSFLFYFENLGTARERIIMCRSVRTGSTRLIL